MDTNGCNIKTIAAVAVTIVAAFAGGAAEPGAVNAKFAMTDFGFDFIDYLIKLSKILWQLAKHGDFFPTGFAD
ncbi:MAG TPA: hypothetical protein VI583_16600 [Cyclobacteriaceae bacterium]|nr:hypothetical protein [Cyclobacteriaceae bacterium]